MSNTFWSVFLGAALGMFTVNLATVLVDEWQHKQRHKRLDLLWEHIEDLEAEDDED
jgi:putative Ca2+/H+ antiporter (TMEM165/GDT1 family)